MARAKNKLQWAELPPYKQINHENPILLCIFFWRDRVPVDNVIGKKAPEATHLGLGKHISADIPFPKKSFLGIFPPKREKSHLIYKLKGPNSKSWGKPRQGEQQTASLKT